MLIGKIEIPELASLAPMAGVTDRAFREICSDFGASFLTSEMISVKGLIYNDKKTLELLSHKKDGKPFAVQLFGREPEDFYSAAKIVSNLGVDIIDINMGCPAPKIVKSGAGSYLMKEPKLCGEIVKAVKKATDLPVTVKIRSGIDENHKNAIQIAKECEYSGADAITIHGRTREQMYSGNADLDIIKNVANSVNIPVIGNGDITSYKKAKFMLDSTGCQMVAIGRAALGNPWIFKSINLKNDSFPLTIEERIKVMKAHIEKIIKYKGENIGMKEARKHLSWYIKGINGASILRKKIFEITTFNDFLKICNIMQNNI